jgi:hypothetical protein
MLLWLISKRKLEVSSKRDKRSHFCLSRSVYTLFFPQIEREMANCHPLREGSFHSNSTTRSTNFMFLASNLSEGMKQHASIDSKH